MDVLSFFEELVQIYSPSKGEAGVCNCLEDILKRWGFRTDVDQWGNLLAQRDGIGKPTLLCANMDTVEPGNGIIPVVKDGWVKSQTDTILGGDNKAWLSAIMAAVDIYISRNDAQNAIELLFTVREEIGGGAEHFDVSKLTASNGVIFDSSAQHIGEIVITSPFIEDFTATFIGKAAHASRSDKGINALAEAAKFVTLQEQGKLDSGETTINIGKFNSGTGNNTVPELAIVNGQIRSFNQTLFNSWKDTITQNAKAAEDKSSLKLKWEGYCPGYSLSPDDPFIAEVEQVLRDHSLIPTKAKLFVITDSNPLVNLGVNVVSISDGVHDPHTKEERIRVSDLYKLCDLAYAFIS